MIISDHEFAQGLTLAHTEDGVEQVCRKCGGSARAHGTRVAGFGRIPWPGVTPPDEPMAVAARSPWYKRLWIAFRHPTEGLADHVRFGGHP